MKSKTRPFKTISLILFLFTTFSFYAHSQSLKPNSLKDVTTSSRMLSGTVTNEQGELLSYASVVVLKDGKYIERGTTTNIEGYFTLEIRNNQAINLSISYVGYKTETMLISSKEMDTSLDLDIQLKPSIDLPTVVVRASGSKSISSTSCTYIQKRKEPIIYTEKKQQVFPPKANITSIFPNPFIHFINVDLNLLQGGKIRFDLYNVAGTLVFSDIQTLPQGQQRVTLNFTNNKLIDGSYFLSISNANTEIQTQHIIKIEK